MEFGSPVSRPGLTKWQQVPHPVSFASDGRGPLTRDSG